MTQQPERVPHAAGEPQDDATRDFSDPAFVLANARSLHIDTASRGDPVLDHFAHLVVSHPQDLRAHVQRINLCVKQSDANSVYGALLDLFLVLGEKGGALRKRMYEAAHQALDPETRNLFEQRLASGISATDVLPVSSASVLSRGLRGSTSLIERSGDGTRETRDPREEANECLEYGQVDAARRILEAAVLAQPERAELHNDLLEIYQRTGDLENFLEMQEKLAAGDNPLADAWELMAASFGTGGPS